MPLHLNEENSVLQAFTVHCALELELGGSLCVSHSLLVSAANDDKIIDQS